MAPAIGIDLGTTNSALAFVDERGAVRILDVPQLVAPGEVGRLATLPSFLFLPPQEEQAAGTLALPWNPAPAAVVGTLAREHGALVPSRQVASAKSWLVHPAVDRTAKLLPWGFEEGPRVSPVQASAHILEHLRDAWNHERPTGGDVAPIERLAVVLTVPASFDEEARELTVQAARDAGFEHLTLLEEPLAALYAWIAAHRRTAGTTLERGGLILVCDVGGGTTDFSLIRADVEEGDLRFERIAIGEHLLLGGDNLDLALAVLVESKLTAAGGPPRLTLAQRQHLRRKCSAAKEALFDPAGPDHVRITILGAGRGVVGGGMTADLAREEAVGALAEGFLPLVAATDWPARDRRVGLRELGLPYESEPAITKHLAAFLARAARAAGADGLARPEAVLFNGGFFAPELARRRVLDALASWFGSPPLVLENERPEAAVAVGAAFYGRLRRHPDAARRLLIRAGSARAYYVGVEAPEAGAGVHAVCVLARGTQEGTTVTLDRRFTVMTNRPLGFTLYSSTERTDAPDAVVTFGEGDEVHRHAPLVTALRYGKRSRSVPLEVTLRVAFTETGTLELWCESTSTEHRWRLSFNLRGVESDPLEITEADADAEGESGVVVADEALERAVHVIRQVFGAPGGTPPDVLVGEIENILGHGKADWPLGAIRRLADALLEAADGRRLGPHHETRWLNLAGFCTRPGFGTPLDAWRVSELRKVYASGLAFPKEIQNQVEWLVLWQRVGAGFSAGQQRELAQRVAGQLGIGQRKSPRLNPQIEREGWRLLGSLERLEASQRIRFGDELLERTRREPRNAAWLWTIGRFGARAPLYGPLSSVVPPAVAGRWIDRLLSLRVLTPDVALAVAQIGARTDDPARDIGDEARSASAEKLADAGLAEALWRALVTVVPPDRGTAGRVFGESLPEGLRIA